jgi:hypothetical protein
MVNINLHTIENELKLGLVRLNIVYPMTKKSHFRLLNNLSVTLSNDAIIIIPKDFEFDGSSAPRFLWWLFPSYGDFFFAALIHDFMYQTKYLADELGEEYAQKLADKEMLLWSNRINKKNIGKTLDNYCRYYAVRLFGKKVYKN